ncbi:MAG TPA: ABC transporter permease [Firmicutes bacterium]|nr:ABC transporter permease [Bacillota bacterium]
MRIKALIKRIILQLWRDKRTLALLFVAPLLMLSLLYVFFNGETVHPKMGVYQLEDSVIALLEESDFDVLELSHLDAQILTDKNLDATLQKDGDQYVLTLENSDPTVSQTVELKVKQLLQQASLKNATAVPIINIETNYIYGSADTVLFDVLNPILVGVFVFFFVFLISGIGLLRERTTGTLERLMSTPVSKYEVVLGYLLGYGIFAVIQTFIIVFFTIYVLNMVLVGSIWNVLLINLCTAFTALSLGILLSTFANTEFQMIQFIPIVVVPQVFFSGIFSLEGLPEWVGHVAKVMPIYYVADALKGVMYKGYGFADIKLHLGVLLCFIVVFVILNIVALRKYRK